MTEMMNLLVNLKLYMKEKMDIDDQLFTGDEILFVIEKVYPVCHLLEKIISKETFEKMIFYGVPNDIREMSNSIFGAVGYVLSESMIKKLWSYMLILLISIKESELKIEKFDKKVDFLSKKNYEETVCTQYVIDDVENLKAKRSIILSSFGDDEDSRDKYISETSDKFKEEVDMLQIKNCIVQAFIKMIEKVEEFYDISKENDKKFVLEEIDLLFVYNIISYYTNTMLPDINDPVEKQEDTHKLAKLLESRNIQPISMKVVSFFNNLISILSNQDKNAKYRIIFFCGEYDKKTSRPKKDISKDWVGDKGEQERIKADMARKGEAKDLVKMAPRNVHEWLESIPSINVDGNVEFEIRIGQMAGGKYIPNVSKEIWQEIYDKLKGDYKLEEENTVVKNYNVGDDQSSLREINKEGSVRYEMKKKIRSVDISLDRLNIRLAVSEEKDVEKLDTSKYGYQTRNKKRTSFTDIDARVRYDLTVVTNEFDKDPVYEVEIEVLGRDNLRERSNNALNVLAPILLKIKNSTISTIKTKQERVNELMAKLLDMQFDDEDSMSKEEAKEHRKKMAEIQRDIAVLGRE
jgi:hypothetical protein